jgi:hypothetical protein
MIAVLSLALRRLNRDDKVITVVREENSMYFRLQLFSIKHAINTTGRNKARWKII